MANFKPYPKKQKEISISQQKPFDVVRGNPNIPTNPNKSQTGIDFNRSSKLSVKNDASKEFSIGLQDLDESIFYYFNNVIQPFVYQNGGRRTVPVIYGSPERWKSFRRDGYYRDKGYPEWKSRLKRDTITKDRSTYNKLDSNMPNLYGSFETGFNSKNEYSNFNLLNNRKPVKQLRAVVVPDYVTLGYSFIVQTYYMEQLNKIIEIVEYASDSYWGNPERFKFKTTVDTFSTATELTVGQDRLVKGTFNINLRGYIIPDVIQKDLNSIKKYNTKAKVTITSETVSNISNVSSPSNIENPNKDGRIR